MVFRGHHLALEFEQSLAILGDVDESAAIERRFFHQFDSPRQTVGQLVGVAEQHPFVLQGDIGDMPAVAASHHNLVGWHADIREERLAELGAAGHRDQWAHLNARRIHGDKKVGQPIVLALVELSTAEEEHHVGVVGRTRPDFLAIDDELAILDTGAGFGGGKVGARTGLRIALAPNDVTADGRPDPLNALLLRSDLEQCRHQHGNALVHDARRHARVREFFGDDRQFQDVDRQAEAAIFAGNVAGKITALQQKLLPIQGSRVRPLPSAPRFRRKVAVFLYEAARFLLEGAMSGAVAEVHRDALSQARFVPVTLHGKD